MDLLILIGCSMLGQLLFILLDVRHKFTEPEFDIRIWSQRNLAFSIISLVISGLIIIIPYTNGTEMTAYTAILQGMSLDVVLKQFKSNGDR